MDECSNDCGDVGTYKIDPVSNFTEEFQMRKKCDNLLLQIDKVSGKTEHHNSSRTTLKSQTAIG